MIFGKVVCFFKGHKRGRFVHGPISAGISLNGPVTIRPYNVFACPRCGRETRYKVKAIQRDQP